MERSNHQVIEDYYRLVQAGDFEGIQKFVDADFVMDGPQSRERVRGTANALAILNNYPGLPDVAKQRVTGSADRWVVGPSFNVLRITGMGDHYVSEDRLTYPNGEVWYTANIFEFRNGRIAKMTTYFAPEYPAPEWRSRWVEQLKPVEANEPSGQG